MDILARLVYRRTPCVGCKSDADGSLARMGLSSSMKAWTAVVAVTSSADHEGDFASAEYRIKISVVITKPFYPILPPVLRGFLV